MFLRVMITGLNRRFSFGLNRRFSLELNRRFSLELNRRFSLRSIGENMFEGMIPGVILVSTTVGSLTIGGLLGGIIGYQMGKHQKE